MRLDPLLAIARTAGAAIMRIYSREFTVQRKADASPLTEADLASHRVIADGLAAEYPGMPVLSEESVEHVGVDERRSWDRYWLVDPLDGTKEFIKRNGQFTVNIALIEGGRPVTGVVFAAAREWLYWGSCDGGAFKAVEDAPAVPIRCGTMPSFGRLRVVGSSSHMSTATSDYIETLRSVYENISFIGMGSSLKICLVAENAADLYPRLAPTMEWDTAAAHAVLNAAGGRLLDHATGRDLQYNKDVLLNGWFIVKGVE